MIGVIAACLVAPLLSLFALGAFKVSSRADDSAEQVSRQIAEGGAAIPSFHSTSLNLEGPQDHA